MVKEIVMYTDGSFQNKKSGPICGYGVHFDTNDVKDMSRPFRHEPLTNQRAELYAIYKGIGRAIRKGYDKITIYTDSDYSINCITTWIKKWKKNGWKNSEGRQVLNTDLIKKIDAFMSLDTVKISFNHVKSHTGNQDKISKGNDIADALAKAGANKTNL